LLAVPRVTGGLHNDSPGRLVAHLGMIGEVFDHHVLQLLSFNGRGHAGGAAIALTGILPFIDGTEDDAQANTRLVRVGGAPAILVEVVSREVVLGAGCGHADSQRPQANRHKQTPPHVALPPGSYRRPISRHPPDDWPSWADIAA